MRILDIKEGQILQGVSDDPVTVISVSYYGEEACQLTYKKNDGSINEEILYTGENISVLEPSSKRTYSADGDIFKLVAEAKRIRQAYLFDPYYAVHSSSIEPLPHQISAVYEEMLPKHPLRYVLADDPGAGKTIMTGLLLKELIIRADVKRALIVSPGNLVEQWQDELYQKFNLRFDILTNDMLEGAAGGNAFLEHDFLIARLDKLSRNEEIQKKLEASEWDIVIIDEAHKLSASVIGNKTTYTKRYQLGKLLSSKTRHFLLLTATPHNGKMADFLKFMSLIDEDRFQCHSENVEVKIDTSDVMRRLVKEDLLKFDGKPLFPERIAETVSYQLSGRELELYEAVSDYVRAEFNRAERLNKDKKNAVGFALTVLQRRLASSPEAIYQSLRRRRERLENRLEEIQRKPFQRASLFFQLSSDIDFEDYDDLPEDESSFFEDDVLDGATAAETMEELGQEIESLKRLETDADVLRKSEKDRKWEELSELLQAPVMKDSDGRREKIIIFTEHKDTLRYLSKKIRSLLGRSESVITIQGGMSRSERKKAELEFKQNKDVSVLIATDAAGEGINLQRAHLMINYDLPWNPNRIEQRFGRIHRIGQNEICRLWNLVAENTREGDVFKHLFDKLNIERDSLGGKVFDILGRVTFGEKSLKDLLIDAVRYGNDPVNREKINTVVNTSLDTEHLMNLIRQYALSDEIMDASRINEIKENMERMDAKRLQPFYIQAFFENAMKAAGGIWHRREKDRFEITRVPNSVTSCLVSSGYNKVILPKYERVCFKKEAISIDGKPEADLLSPGHPLLDALIAWTIKKYGNDYNDGAVLISDKTDVPKIMCSLETSFKDGTESVVFKQLRFVEMDKEGALSSAGFAPYLDYEKTTEEIRGEVVSVIQDNSWLRSNDFEAKVSGFAVTNIMPRILEQLKKSRTELNDKIADQVESRLTSEINYWDKKANECKGKMREKGESQALKLQIAAAAMKADDLYDRLKARKEELEREKNIIPLPPVLSSVAIVIPKQLIERQSEEIKESDRPYGNDKKVIEEEAMNRVMALERSFGFIPRDVSKDNCGYDIESYIPEELRSDSHSLRFIEVKGRSASHGDTVTVSKNEVLTALNTPNQFILAIVSVDGATTHTTYLRKPFEKSLDVSAVSVNFMIKWLLNNSEVIYED